MMKRILLISLILLLGCKEKSATKKDESKVDTLNFQLNDTLIKEESTETKKSAEIVFNIENAERLVKLPLSCIQIEYPNKLDHVISSSADLESPQKLHPAFYGCFDWHSSVHAHWSLIRLLKEFPELSQAEEIKEKLLENISKTNIEREVKYFKTEADRKSTRLNSSHVAISYAVFSL